MTDTDALEAERALSALREADNAIEEALLFVDRHIEQDHAKPLRAVLKNARAAIAEIEGS